MATCIERTFVYYNFPSCNLVPLEAEQNDFRHRETNICVQGNVDDLHIFTDHFSPLVRLSLSLSHFLLLSTDFFALSSFLCVSLVLWDHASALMCERESVCVYGSYTLR